MIAINIGSKEINSLDLTPVQDTIDAILNDNHKAQIKFIINFSTEPGDPRELSEIPEIRLWFIRLDSQYPWLPLYLDWAGGELARYVAMLIPHQFSRRDGIQYNPEALEIWVMQKVFVITNWLKTQGQSSPFALKDMTQMLGYELDEELFKILI